MHYVLNTLDIHKINDAGHILPAQLFRIDIINNIIHKK